MPCSRRGALASGFCKIDRAVVVTVQEDTSAKCVLMGSLQSIDNGKALFSICAYLFSVGLCK